MGVIAPLLLGLLAEIIYMFFSFRDKKLQAQAVADLVTPEFNPAVITDANVKARTDKALEYWSLIDEAINQTPQGVLRNRLEKTTGDIGQAQGYEFLVSVHRRFPESPESPGYSNRLGECQHGNSCCGQPQTVHQ